MKGPMQLALGAAWHRLPPALQAHHACGATTESGMMTIAYPCFMQPVLHVLHSMGALVKRGGTGVATVVDKTIVGERQVWRRTFRYPDGTVAHFNSYWVHVGGNRVVEYVNPLLGLEMAVCLVDGQLHYSGVRFVIKLGSWQVAIPEWLALGHTRIVEEAIDARHFAMDFDLTHPLFGRVFRYAGRFATGGN